MKLATCRRVPPNSCKARLRQKRCKTCTLMSTRAVNQHHSLVTAHCPSFYWLGDNCQILAVRSDICKIGQLSDRTTVSADNCQIGQLSVRTTVSGDNCQWGQLSVAQLSEGTVRAFLALGQLLDLTVLKRTTVRS